MGRGRLGDLGIKIGTLQPGTLNAITDIEGVAVGYSTIIEDKPYVVRTGVTAIWPRLNIWCDYVYAGYHSFNGNGEMTGTIWVAEQGMVGMPICITNTHSVGIVRDALCQYAVREGKPAAWHLPIVAETYDGWLSNAEKFPVLQKHAFEALDNAKSGAIAEGNVGGGTGMMAHDFKGGTGTASRIVTTPAGTYTVGALVQANYGTRQLFRVDGVPVGEMIGADVVPTVRYVEPQPAPRAEGSIIVILATDAPLLPIQCQRLARRATIGLAWVGGIGNNSSGDIFLAFSTGNTVRQDDRISNVRTVSNDSMSPLFLAAAEATQEAILNAMCQAETMTGFEGHTCHELPHDRLVNAMRKAGRL
ncbi:MAG: P1 family peptidase [Dongiaceae bacterium]